MRIDSAGNRIGPKGRLTITLSLLALWPGPSFGQGPVVGPRVEPRSDLNVAPPHQRVVFDSTPFSGEGSVPHWEKGYLISRNVQVWGADDWAVRLYGEKGSKTREIHLWFPDAVRVIVRSAALTRDGRVVLAGSAEKADRTMASFIAATDMTDKVSTVIRTDPYAVATLCVAPDDTVWTFGWSKELPSEPTLRQFDLERGELKAWLPRSTFQTQLNPSASRGEGSFVALSCTADRVAIYSEITSEFIEVTYSGHAIHRWPITRKEGDLSLAAPRITGTASGEILAVLGSNSNLGGPRGLFRLQRDEANQVVGWVPIKGHTTHGWRVEAILRILGVDGDSLVYQTDDDWSAVKWARLERN